ncbi:rhamnulokinase family protein [Bacteroidota bacterium]
MSDSAFLAFDIGASGGRAILGTINNNKLEIKEIYRFPNKMIYINGHYHWDIYSLFENIKTGISLCVKVEKQIPCSIGVDTWGVDFVLLNSEGEFTSLPFAYRDSMFNGKREEFFQIMPAEELYKLTGIQFLPFNSIFQIFAVKKNKPELLEKSDKLLFMPDALNYMLTGIKKTEYTIASTSQLLNPSTKYWEEKIFDKLNISSDLMCEIVYPGEKIGDLNKDLCKELGIDPIPVVAVGSHDTASAIASVPVIENNWAYLSSGTWSLIGVELEQPLINKQAEKLQFTNEGGVENSVRFLKNICGLWLLQECKKVWEKENDYSYEELIGLSKKGKAFRSIIDPDAADFLNPTNMPEAIREYCKRTDQPVPEDHASIVRCILESLALKYKYVLDQLQETTSDTIKNLHLIGGGSKNDILNQYTANATGLKVIAGPSEATSIGNILMQAKAMGNVNSIQEMRLITANSFELKTYLPTDLKSWDEASEKFRLLVSC